LKLTVTNVAVTCSEFSDYALSCVCDGATYHVWLDRKTREVRKELFKNPIPPYNYKTRHLRTSSKFSAEVIRLMLCEANDGDMFHLAEKAVQRKKAEDRAQNDTVLRINRIKENGPDLLVALQELVSYIYEFWPDEPLFSLDESKQADPIRNAHAAIRKARGES
jgi:hypothetical protein